MALPEYPPEWDEPEDDELEDLDLDEEYGPDPEPDDEEIERALHDYERRMYGD